MSIHYSSFIFAYSCVFAVVLGAVLGSFLNCAAWRIAHGQGFLTGHSRCPSCGHSLGGPDLVPVLSWVFLRGKCRYCKTKISVRYPLTELFFALVTLACLLNGDLRILTLRNLVFLCCLFCLSLVDLECSIIPDGCHIVALAVWLAALPFSGMGWGEIGLHLLAGLVFGGGILLISLLMDKLLHKESMGGGDIKLFAVMGVYLGFLPSLFAVILSCFFGLLFALVRRLLPGEREEQFPFGPSIAAATAVVLLYGRPVVDWYLRLLNVR